MDNHDAVKKMAHAKRLCNEAITHHDNKSCGVISRLEELRDIIHEVGEGKFGKEFINELRQSEAV